MVPFHVDIVYVPSDKVVLRIVFMVNSLLRTHSSLVDYLAQVKNRKNYPNIATLLPKWLCQIIGLGILEYLSYTKIEYKKEILACLGEATYCNNPRVGHETYH